MKRNVTTRRATDPAFGPPHPNRPPPVPDPVRVALWRGDRLTKNGRGTLARGGKAQ